MVALVAALAFGSVVLSAQAATNVTVDDTDASHVTYNVGAPKAPGWNAEPGCAACSLKPDASQAYNHTWHDDLWIAPDDALYANITFTGTAVYLFNIIPNNEINANTNLTFVVDGDTKSAKSFVYAPNNQSDFLYNQTVFSATGLSNAHHTVQMSTFGSNSTGDLAILFDYFIYTSEDEMTSSGSTSASSTGSSTSTSPSSAKSTGSAPTSTATSPASAGTTSSASTSPPASTSKSSAASVKAASGAVMLSLVGATVFGML